MTEEQPQLSYSREDYEEAIKDAGTINLWIGFGLGLVFTIVSCLALGYYFLD